MPLTDITGLDADGARAALAGVLPAVDFASVLLPELRERGDGGLLFAGGLSSAAITAVARTSGSRRPCSTPTIWRTGCGGSIAAESGAKP